MLYEAPSTYIMAVSKNQLQQENERQILTKKKGKKTTEPQGRRAVVDKLGL